MERGPGQSGGAACSAHVESYFPVISKQGGTGSQGGFTVRGAERFNRKLNGKPTEQRVMNTGSALWGGG
ncbi:hypothetical protein J6590_013293 [Homalodisca vitripennis]|nr:hypothetical protein J6590_013293 [Homalodisca vitripennis]